MSVHRTGKRRPGRPLLGTEPLDARLTVMVSRSTMRRIEARAGGHVAEFVRGVLDRALGVRAAVKGRGRARGGRRVVSRYLG